jgi:hypothetical protein
VKQGENSRERIGEGLVRVRSGMKGERWSRARKEQIV